MRGGQQSKTARVLIFQHQTDMAAVDCCTFGSSHPLNYSSGSRVENAKHVFEYLYTFLCESTGKNR